MGMGPVVGTGCGGQSLGTVTIGGGLTTGVVTTEVPIDTDVGRVVGTKDRVSPGGLLLITGVTWISAVDAVVTIE